MADAAKHPLRPLPRAALLTGALALPPALIVGLVASFVKAVAGVVVFLGVAAALAIWVRVAAPRRLLTGLPGAKADPLRHARLINLVEGLCARAGLRMPVLRVFESAGCNAMVAGLDAGRAVLVVTTGLLEGLNRVELEAVLAEELVKIRRLEMVPATVCAAAFGWGARLAFPRGRDTDNDEAAVTLTRYPPGLIAAFARMQAKGTEVTNVRRGHEALWLADPGPATSAGGRAYGRHVPLAERIGALRQL